MMRRGIKGVKGEITIKLKERMDAMEMLLRISSVQSLSLVQLSVTPWTAALQNFLSITSSWSLLKLMSIE